MAVFKRLIFHLGLAFAFFSVFRLAFYVPRTSFFGEGVAAAFLQGFRFDAVAIAWLFMPFLLVAMVQMAFPKNRGVKIAAHFFYLLAISLSVILSGIDQEYFNFTLKRSSTDIFLFWHTLENQDELILSFFSDYWKTALFYMALLGLWAFVYFRSHRWAAFRESEKNTPKTALLKTVGAVALVAMVVLATRGGIQLKPLMPADAARLGGPKNAALVLNTPFTVLKSLEDSSLPEADFMPQAEAEEIVKFEKMPFSGDVLPGKPNVVVLVVESLSREYMGIYNAGAGYTPFLDSLLGRSAHFANAYANGRKSIEGLPAIVSGIPALMDKPFLNSRYGQNKIDGLPARLKEMGYQSAFWHGAANGTMNFDSYARMAGFDHYFGLNEYPDAAHYDGHWGIWDEYYLPHTAREMTKISEPFFQTVFSLSSHHPFAIPTHWEEKTPEGAPIQRAIFYADQAVKAFFAEAKKQPWYNNTLFVITGDHTGPLVDKRYNHSGGYYAVPIAFFYPGKDVDFPLHAGDAPIQHIDIFPTLLDLVGYEKPYGCFGQSRLRSKNGFTINFLHPNFTLIQNGWFVSSTGEEIDFQTRLSPDGHPMDGDGKFNNGETELLRKLQALVQEHHRRMRQNQLTHK